MANLNIQYYSTNHQSPQVSFDTALLQGIAPDKGLYMPTEIPVLTPSQISNFQHKTYPQIAAEIFHLFLNDLISESELIALAQEAYAFAIPIEKITDQNYIMRLDQGPTASFKDFAARMMARLMQFFLKKEQKSKLILVATSGDTGSAIANAYYNLSNIQVVVLFPEKEVSERQRKQMTTLHQNIVPISIDGKFDDCQAMVKQAFVDSELIGLNLTSANSINFGRLLPQIVYYFYAYSRVCASGGPIIMTIPSGNFGNMMGAVFAKKMGLPIEKLIVATNENDEFPVFLSSAAYKKIVPSRFCLSNAMNVGHPSNLARLIDLFGGKMDETGQIYQLPDMQALNDLIYSQSISDAVTRETIASVYAQYKTILEPHGAVGWACQDAFLKEYSHSTCPCVLVETAHPAKFPETIQDVIHIDPPLPDSLQGLENKKEQFDSLSTEYASFKHYLLNRL